MNRKSYNHKLRKQLSNASETILQLRNEINRLKEELDVSYELIDYWQDEYRISQEAIHRQNVLF